MPNHLARETSPYLLQHSQNPVDWYPWGDAALARAMNEDKPILLSIGYSACHWCHVMAHESFENVEIARTMNENFINIKVDREERPDLDTVFMDAVQSISGSGGWPLTVFLTPEAKPFYGGTYFPPEDRNGMPGFPRVLMMVSAAYRNRRKEVEQATGQIVQALSSQVNSRTGSPSLEGDILNQAFSTLGRSFDKENAGFGGAPKFPQPMVLEFLLRYYYRTGARDSLDMVAVTLEKMARGGIYDQIGGGFHRYATDNHWLVPHFEKMLYDNAQLSRIYLQAFQVTGAPLFRRIAEETIDYVLREMRAPEGGFYSTQDADSEGQEGKYYLWTSDEIGAVLDDKTAVALKEYFGVSKNGNFEGSNILHVAGNVQPVETGIFSSARALLLKERGKRVRPGVDRKILTSWNGLMLASLAEAAGTFSRKDYLKAAVTNGAFLLDCVTPEGYLKHVCSQTTSRIDGFLEDYALVIEGLLNLHQVTLESKWLAEAVRLTGVMIREFWDDAAAIFYDTGKQQPALFVRPTSIHDGASPSGSSAAVRVLLKVGHLTGDKRFEKIALRSLLGIQESLPSYPLAFGNWLCALDFHLSAKQEIVVSGSYADKNMGDLMQVLFNAWLPNKVLAAFDPADPGSFTGLELFNGKAKIDNRATVYVCEGYTCQAPVTNPEALGRLLHKPANQS